MAQVQSDGNCPDWSDWLKRATSGSESQGAPSFNSLPGIQSGTQALEGSMRLRREDKCGSVARNFRRLSVYRWFTKVPIIEKGDADNWSFTLHLYLSTENDDIDIFSLQFYTQQ